MSRTVGSAVRHRRRAAAGAHRRPLRDREREARASWSAERLQRRSTAAAGCRSSTSRPTTRPTARRSTPTAGPGLTEGLRILRRVKDATGLPVLSDVPRRRRRSGPAAEVLDVLQMPAFLCRQTDLVAGLRPDAASRSTSRRGSSWRRATWATWSDKIALHGQSRRSSLTERGTSFGYNNLVVDFRGLADHAGARLSGGLRRHPLRPAPGRCGEPLGRRAPVRARCSRAPRWRRAWTPSSWRCTRTRTAPLADGRPLSDGPNMLRLDDLPRLLGASYPRRSAPGRAQRPPDGPRARLLRLAERVLRLEAESGARARGQASTSASWPRWSSSHRCRGRVIVTGMGKSGLIGRKIAATIASTGTPGLLPPSRRGRPRRRRHGGPGRRGPGAVELGRDRRGARGAARAQAARACRWSCSRVVPLPRWPTRPTSCSTWAWPEEACPMNLAPTSSTTAALAMGDALAMALLDLRGLGPEDYAALHPAGRLGWKALVQGARSHAHRRGRAHRRRDTPPMKEAIEEMTAKRLGMTTVVDAARAPRRHRDRRRPPAAPARTAPAAGPPGRRLHVTDSQTDRGRGSRRARRSR